MRLIRPRAPKAELGISAYATSFETGPCDAAVAFQWRRVDQQRFSRTKTAQAICCPDSREVGWHAVHGRRALGRSLLPGWNAHEHRHGEETGRDMAAATGPALYKPWSGRRKQLLRSVAIRY